MIAFRNVPGINVVEFTIEGKVTPEDVQKIVPQFVAAAEKHDVLRILKEVRNIERLDSAAFGEQIGEVFKHWGDITHVALVADKEWEPAVAQMASVYPFQVQFFEPSQIEAARRWLQTAE